MSDHVNFSELSLQINKHCPVLRGKMKKNWSMCAAKYLKLTLRRATLISVLMFTREKEKKSSLEKEMCALQCTLIHA